MSEIEAIFIDTARCWKSWTTGEDVVRLQIPPEEDCRQIEKQIQQAKFLVNYSNKKILKAFRNLDEMYMILIQGSKKSNN